MLLISEIQYHAAHKICNRTGKSKNILNELLPIGFLQLMSQLLLGFRQRTHVRLRLFQLALEIGVLLTQSALGVVEISNVSLFLVDVSLQFTQLRFQGLDLLLQSRLTTVMNV